MTHRGLCMGSAATGAAHCVFTVVTFLAALTPAAAQTAPKASGGANLGSAQLMATVYGDGTLNLARSKGVAACIGPGGKCRNSTGNYVVVFARNLDGCSVTGSSVANTHRAMAAVDGTDRVQVIMLNTAGDAAVDSNFSLHVLC